MIAFVPLFFPRVPFLDMATMMLGVLETVMHVAMIKMFRLPRFYSPGLAAAIVLLLPISIYAFAYVSRHEGISHLLAVRVLYILFGLVVASRSSSGRVF